MILTYPYHGWVLEVHWLLERSPVRPLSVTCRFCLVANPPERGEQRKEAGMGLVGARHGQGLWPTE